MKSRAIPASADNASHDGGCEPDPASDTAFAEEAGAFADVFGDSLIAIHHVGSTSNPGLHAKPSIDILVVLREPETVDRFSASMEGLGSRDYLRAHPQRMPRLALRPLQ